MEKISLDSSLNELSTDALTMQNGSAEPLLASFFYGESLGGCGFVTVLPTNALQAALDSARGELPSDTRTLISHWEILRGKIGEIWRSDIAISGTGTFNSHSIFSTGKKISGFVYKCYSINDPSSPKHTLN